MPEEPELTPEQAEEKERERQARKTRREELLATRTRAAQLRTAGYSYLEIAKTLGYANASGAWKAVEAVRKDAIRESGRELVNLELERFDTLQRAAMTRAIGGDPSSIRAALRVMDQRARMLGLYKSPVDERIPDAREAFAILLGGLKDRYGEPPADPTPEDDQEHDAA
jgi:hypothetical protein